ncbi:UDP-2,3-diacylglucosamine diphosphatase [Hugenholtzia roseola]|uniref:UDP-2,3-diacylglucosamine diphosphatase n=1 Tax=Hugenholtzia roseola TaxID=1002 RepID=UPI0003F89297|nr:UDP-2,3-diacylglucosamine diphosphatase [Hugenholtzia roseola]
MRRKVELLVFSDVHLGTYGAKAEALLQYLHSIEPQVVVLNGDLIDGWQFSRSYFPKAHVQVLRQLLDWAAQGKRMYYVAGNHDEMMRKFIGLRLVNVEICNKVKLNLDGKTAWFFHGDVFDVTMQHSKWIAQWGAKGYAFLIFLNKIVNFFSKKLGFGKISLSKRIKESVKKRVKSSKQIKHSFEQTAADIALAQGYDYVICGHTHQPLMRTFQREGKQVCYLNSGDWVENLTALEYRQGSWHLYQYGQDLETQAIDIEPLMENMDLKVLFGQMVGEVVGAEFEKIK